MKNLTWQNPGQLFVAQELINKVKSKCCGIKVEILLIVISSIFCLNRTEDFSKPKIMYPNMTKYLPFYYDEKGFYQNDKSFMITGAHVSYLAAFLNSSLFKFCFRDNFPELLGGTRELRKIFFDKTPVLQVSDYTNGIFREKVNAIQSNYTKEQAKEIDTRLFDLYNLTDDERKIIGLVEIV